MSRRVGEVPPHFVVFVPGYMGSKLRYKASGEVLWVDPGTIPVAPWKWGGWLDRLLGDMAYPNEGLEPSGIMDQVVFVPRWAKQQHYNRLIEKLIEMGYKADPAQCFGHGGGTAPYDERELDCYAFPYDWRQDNRESARLLSEAIECWRSYHPGEEVWVIAHSNGGLVARWYIEMLGGKEHVTRLFLMGSPWDGTPKAMHMAFGGLDTLFRRSFNLFDIPARTRDLIRTFPSIYQLIPHRNPFLRNPENEEVNPFTYGSWVKDDRQRALLEDGRRFAEDLGSLQSVENVVCFFGTRHATPTAGRVSFGAANTWSGILWEDSQYGDGTIPTRSATHPGAHEKLPYPVSHGDIYVNDFVLEKLRYEMVDKYRTADTTRASAFVGNLQITFENEPDVCAPGQPIKLKGTIRKREGKPVSGALITVTPVWLESLPGSAANAAFGDSPETHLAEVTDGEYEGTLRAPDAEGYCRLVATVKVKGQMPVRLEELVAVEAEVAPAALTAPEGAAPEG